MWAGGREETGDRSGGKGDGKPGEGREERSIREGPRKERERKEGGEILGMEEEERAGAGWGERGETESAVLGGLLCVCHLEWCKL